MTTLQHLLNQWRALTAARQRRLAELERLDHRRRRLADGQSSKPPRFTDRSAPALTAGAFHLCGATLLGILGE